MSARQQRPAQLLAWVIAGELKLWGLSVRQARPLGAATRARAHPGRPPHDRRRVPAQVDPRRPRLNSYPNLDPALRRRLLEHLSLLFQHATQYGLSTDDSAGQRQ
jgi:hypothetical protein